MSRGGVGERPEYAMNHRVPAMASLYSVIEALVQVPVVRDLDGRNYLVTLIVDDLNGQVAIQQYTAHRLHVVHIVDACRKHPDGLRALTDALRIVDPDSLPMQEVLRRLADVEAHPGCLKYLS